MKRILCLLITILLYAASAGGSQSDDPLYDLLTQNRQYECLDIVSNAKGMLPDYFALGKRDSAIIIMEYVENRCGIDVFEMLRLLLEIESGDLSPIWCESDLVNEIFEVRHYFWDFPFFRAFPDFYSRFHGENEIQYDEFIVEFAKKLAAKTDSSSFGHALCEILAGHKEIVLERLSANQFEGTCLQEKYDELMTMVENDLKEARGRWELGTGIWSPTGANDPLGDKLEINGLAGIKGIRFGMDIIGGIRVLDARDEYIIIENDRPKSTDYFFGGFIELAFNYDILSFGRSDLECFGGIGYDGFGASPKTDEHDSKSIGGWGFCLGVKQRLFYNRIKTRYVGIQFRYDILNYDNKGGTDMPGNAVSLSLIWGFMGNIYEINRARDLHYYDWKDNQQSVR